MSDAGGFGGDTINIDASLDGDSAARLAALIESAIKKGFEAGFAKLGTALNNDKKINAGFKKIQDELKNAFDPKVFAKFTSGLKDSEKEVAAFIATQRALGVAITTTNAGINQVTVRTGKQLTAEKDAANAIKRSQLAAQKQALVDAQVLGAKEIANEKSKLASILQAERAGFDAVGREQRQASQEAVIAASQSAKQRVAITRAVIDQIVRLERGLGSLVSGTVRTGVSAVSRASSAAGSGLGALFRRDAAEVGQSNSLLRRSFTERESVIRTSLTKQETLVRKSVARQEASYDKLRARSSSGVAGAITGRGVGVGLGGLVAGVGLGQLFKGGFTDAVNYTEQLNKTRVVFGKFSAEVVKFSDNAVRGLGSTKAEALQALSTFGNLFRAFGFGEKKAADASVTFTTLATDLASFSNTSVGDAITALNSGLVGESEPLKRYGVILNETTLKAKALALGIYDGIGPLNANTKAQAAYALILEQTTRAQGDFGRTSGDLANAQRILGSAVKQTFSDLAGLLKGVATTVVNAAIPVFDTLSKLIKGDGLSGAMSILRDGIKGVGIALGVLVAAKAGVEVIQLLGTVAKLALTPLGALVLAASAIGAAIAIFAPRSEGFRKFLDDAIDRAKGLAETIKNFVVPLLQRFADFVVSTVVPAVGRFASVVKDKLVVAYHAVVDFIKAEVIPRLQQFATFVVSTVVPAVVDFGKMVQRWFGVGLDKIKEFWHFAEGFLRPAIDGFKTLGSTIASLFSGGGFSNVLGGLGAAGSGVGSTFAKIGSSILEAIKPVGKRILDFLKDVFSSKNLEVLANGFLGFVEAVGRFIGSHVDIIIKSVIAIGAALGAAAVVLAFRFAKGFIDGLTESLPNLLRGAFSGDILSIASLGLIAFGAMKLIGSKGGQGFIEGVKTSVSNGKGFLGALFSGVGGISSSNTSAFYKNESKEIRDTQNQLRILGSTQLISPTNLAQAKAGLKELRAGFTDAQVAALTFRDKVNAGLTAVKVTFRGVGEFVRGDATLKQAFKNVTGDLAAIARTQGSSLGATLGNGVVAGLAAAIGGFATGKAAGKAGTNPLLAGLTTGITTAAVAGPYVGVVAGIAATIGAVLGKADAAAAKFRESIKSLAGALKSDLADALKSASGGVVSLADAFSSGETGAFSKQLIDLLGPKTLETLQKAGIGLADVAAAFKSGDFASIRSVLNADGFNADAQALIALTEAYKATTAAVRGLNAERAFTFANGGREGVGLSNAAAASGKRDTSSREGLGLNPSKADLGSREGVGLSNSLTKVREEAQKAGAALAGVFQKRDASPVVNEAKRIGDKFDTAKISADEFTQSLNAAFGVSSSAKSAAADAIVSIDGIVAQLGQIDLSTVLGKSLEQQNLDEIKAKIVSTISAGVTDGTVKTVEQAGILIYPLLQSALDSVDKQIASGTLTTTAGQVLKDQLITTFTAGFEAAKPVITSGVQSLGVPLNAGLVLLAFSTRVEAVRVGSAITSGVAGGISDPGAVGQLDAKLGALTTKIVKSLKDPLGVKSPSKVTYEIGQNVVQGLSNGISDSVADVGALLETEIGKIIEKAKNAGSKGAKALKGLFGDLFGLSVGSGAVTGPGGTTATAIPNAIGAFTQAFAGLQSGFDSIVSSVFDANAAAASGTGLNSTQANIFGESAFSLNPADLIGSQNLAAFTNAFDSIATIGQNLLASGLDPASLLSSLEPYIDQIRDWAVNLGFSTSSIDQLIESLGLSDSALTAFAANAAAAATAATDGAAAAAALAEAQTAAAQAAADAAAALEAASAAAAAESDAAAAAFQDLISQTAGMTEEQIRAILTRDGLSSDDLEATLSRLLGSQNVNGALPFASTQVFNIYPPTNDVEAIALGIANQTAMLASIPGG